MLTKFFSLKVVSLATALLTIFVIAVFFIQRPSTPQYVTAIVRQGDIEHSVLATGRIDAIERVSVGAQVSGQVKALKVRAGERVVKGQPIADIDDLPQRNELRHAQAAFNVIVAERQARQALVNQAMQRFQRQRKMLREDASSREEFEAAEATLATAQAELQSLKSRLAQAEIEVEKKKVDLSYTRVVAPMDGTVIAVVTHQGQTVNSSQSTPTIIKLARLDVMSINVQISEADITRIFVGQKARFSIFSDPDRHYETRVRAIDLAPESLIREDSPANSLSAPLSGTANASVYYNAILNVPNPENRLRIAMTAQVNLLIEEAKDTLMVPMQAVYTDGANQQQVQVLAQGGKLTERKVVTGISNGVDIQIISGLHLGEVVVLLSQDEEGVKDEVMP